MKVLIATKNQKKLTELSRILEPMGFTVVCEKDLAKPLEDIEETGTTFEENAILKAKAGLKETGFISVADDSGICVDYLGGKPGIYSARYSGGHGNDEENNKKILEELKGVPMEKLTDDFLEYIISVANGKETKNEINGYREISIFKDGVTL